MYTTGVEAHLIFIQYNRDREMFQAGIGVDLTPHQRQSGLFTYLHSYNCSSSNIHGDPKMGAGGKSACSIVNQEYVGLTVRGLL